MSWWNKPGRSTADRASEQTSPVSVEIMSGKLAVRVVPHEIATPQGPISCWSYVTEGLAAHQQAEMVFTLRREPNEPSERFPEDPLHLFATIHQLAEQGRRVSSGSATELGEAGFFGHHLLYVRAQPLIGVTLPSPCLALVLVTADELRAVRTFGMMRVLARMGQASSYYPFPPWADRRRPGLSLERTFEASLLSKLPRASAQDVYVGVNDKRITVRALRPAQPSWQDRLAQVPDGVPLALLTGIDPAASGCLVWVPGQKAPEAIVPPGSDRSRLCGGFIVMLAGQPANGGRFLEDGFAMELTHDAWQAVRRALIEGQEVSIPATGDGMSLALTYRDDVYTSPIDGMVHAAEGGWSDAPSVAEDAPPTGDAKLGHVRLLTPLDQVAARTSIDELAAFIREIKRCAERVLGDRDDQVELLLRLRCRPHGHEVELSGRGETPPEVMQGFFESIKRLASPPVRDGEVSFEFDLTISGTGPHDGPPV